MTLPLEKKDFVNLSSHAQNWRTNIDQISRFWDKASVGKASISFVVPARKLRHLNGLKNWKENFRSLQIVVKLWRIE